MTKRPFAADSLLRPAKFQVQNSYEIIGTGSHLPERVVTNDEIALKLQIDSSWIKPRTGISERRFVSGDVGTRALSIEAARKAISKAGIAPESIGVVVVATSTPDRLTPSTAVSIQTELGLSAAWAFDLSAGCSGYLYAVKVASNLLLESYSPYALVIGVECLSRHIDWSDKKSSVLFGDGAGAVVLKRKTIGGFSKETFLMRSASDDEEFLSIGGKGAFLDHNFNFQMNGREVFKKAVTCMTDTSKELMGNLGLSKDDIKFFIGHQANERILESVGERIGFTQAQMPSNIERVGNTGAASIPILIDELNQKGSLIKGDLLLFSSFGAGFTWASSAFRW